MATKSKHKSKLSETDKSSELKERAKKRIDDDAEHATVALSAGYASHLAERPNLKGKRKKRGSNLSELDRDWN